MCHRCCVLSFIESCERPKISTKSQRGPLSAQQAIGRMRRHQVRREREIKRDRTSCWATFRGRADERIVNFIYQRAADSVNVELDDQNDRRPSWPSGCAQSARVSVLHPSLSAFRAHRRRNILSSLMELRRTHADFAASVSSIDKRAMTRGYVITRLKA